MVLWMRRQRIKTEGTLGGMKNIDLWEKGQIPFYEEELHTGVNEDSCTITPYLIEDGQEHGCIMIFPGGGYVHRAEKEAGPVAEYVNSLGMHAFIVNYRVIPYDPHLGVVDGKRAMKQVRSKMAEFKIKDGCLGVMGFSAGAGNASLTTLTYDEPEHEPKDEVDKLAAKPDFAVFCYGAMSVDPKYFTEVDTKNFEDIVPEEEREEYINANSPDRKVREDMPPTFIWHCVDDARVNVGCCLSFVNAMQAHGVDYECHLFPEGGHGKSIREAKDIPGVCQWPELLADWLRRKHFVGGCHGNHQE